MEIKIGYADPAQIDISVPISLQQSGWQHSQQFCTSANQWQGYLNYLCLGVSLSWLSTTFSSCDFYSPEQMVQEQQIANVWELVDGSIVTIPHWGRSGKRQCRLCLLPHTSYDRSELRVPREWVEIPSWVADYYLAVHIDLDREAAIIWGYGTHAQIQQLGIYDDFDRTYCLDADLISQDLSLLSLAEQIVTPPATRGLTGSIDHLSADRLNLYLTDWSCRQLAIPRLEICEADFPHWLSLLANNTWRQELVERRLGMRTPLIAKD